MMLYIVLSLIPLICWVILAEGKCDVPNYANPITQYWLQQSKLDFTEELLQAVVTSYPDNNVIISPANIYDALLLVYFASGGTTKRTITKALDLYRGESKSNIAGVYLTEKSEIDILNTWSQAYLLRKANNIFLADDVEPRACFKQVFSQEITSINFGDAENASRHINSWVSNQTNHMINQMVSPENLQDDTIAVLVNAIYFKGFWEQKFRKEFSNDSAVFYKANGEEVITTMMYQENDFKIVTYPALAADILEMPYEGEDISMLIILPHEHLNSGTSITTIADLIKQLTSFSNLQRMVRDLEKQESKTFLRIEIPKFSVEVEYDLKQVLRLMGTGDLFDSMDMSDMVDGDFRISKVVHKAKIVVDEEGSEAAASTSMVFDRSSLTTPPVFRANRPFVYALYSKDFNTFLFFGTFNSPSK